MKAKKFLSEFKNTKATNNFLRFLIVALITTIVAEGIIMLNLMDKQRVIVVPINVDRKFSITGDTASPEYVEMMIRQTIYLKENFTPETVRENFKAFLSLIGANTLFIFLAHLFLHSTHPILPASQALFISSTSSENIL